MNSEKSREGQCLEFISHQAKKILYLDEYIFHGKPFMKQKQTFSLVSDIDVEKNVFYVKLNLFKNNFYKTHFQKQPFTNALQNRFSENLQYSELKRDSNTGVFL